jgi:signal transduction histidine kinase
MNHHLLRLSLSEQSRALDWESDLHARGIVLMRAGRLKEALSYARAYSLMAILIDIDRDDSAMLESIRELGGIQPAEGLRPPLIGLAQIDLTPGQRAELAQAGLQNIVSMEDPSRFLLYQLELLAALNELRAFEQSRLDVNKLAHSTRERLHELSQPLSAIQGRLQLLAARCPTDDPNAQTFKDMVRLVFDISHQVMEIHQIHRKFS